MISLSFCLSDYQSGLTDGGYSVPEVLCPYFIVNPVLYKLHGSTELRRKNLRRAVDELRKRTDKNYFNKTYPLQARTLDYSARSFPAYRFILPEVMTEDWLAIVDWGQFQRDHVLHQPLCGYIVLKLLEEHNSNNPLCMPDGKNVFLEACVDKILRWEGTAYIREFLVGCGMKDTDQILEPGSPIARNVWRIFFREAAYVAAVFHDLGYPWQYAERIQNNLDGMNASVIKQSRSAEQVVQLFGHRLLFKVLQGYQTQNAACPSTWNEEITHLTDKALTITHGLPGALGFLHLNDCVRQYPSQRESPLHLLCVEWVAAAIMMHDMSKIYWGRGRAALATPENPFLRLSFDRDPLSAIVTLADVIQEFERPWATFRTLDCLTEGVKLDYDIGCLSTELLLEGKLLTIKYKMKNAESRAIKQKSIPKEVREYFDAQYGYLDMKSLGIKEVQIFAC